MSASDTRVLLEQTIRRFGEDVPALKPLQLVMRVQLQARGAAPIWRVDLPGPKVSQASAGDARLEVTMQRTFFNEMAKDARLEDWAEAYEDGHVKVTGDSAVVRLIGNVIDRQRARAH